MSDSLLPGLLRRQSPLTSPPGWRAAIIGIIYGAWVSYAQTDVKKLVAYSSTQPSGIRGPGYLCIGGLQGTAHVTPSAGPPCKMVNHGISTGGLFLLVGMLYERATRRPSTLSAHLEGFANF